MVKSPQDLLAGITIIAMAVTAFVLGWPLYWGSLDGIGPGLMPRAFAVLLGALGAMLAILAFVTPGARVDGVAWRGLLCLLAAIILFAFTIRPLGLAVAAPATMLVSAVASNETRWGETVLFSIVLSAFCIGLFKFALNLPVPLAPWLLGY
jgi:putative tricarboxylic transport membrane protein